jgi:hypothetical protein
MPANAILSTMLQRLFASMARGASLNCRPHNSRLRLDLTMFSRLKDLDAGAMFETLLSQKQTVTVAARVPMPAGLKLGFGDERIPAADFDLLPQDGGGIEGAEGQDTAGASQPRLDAATQAWLQQRALLIKLRNLSEESRTYEQDTGVHALHIGYPLLSLPPGLVGMGGGGASRVLAPIAFIPVSLSVRTGHKPAIEIACFGQGVDLVVPNAGLFAWLERQTGKPTAPDLADEHGERPWDEIAALVKLVCTRLGIDVPQGLGPVVLDVNAEKNAMGAVDAEVHRTPFVLEGVPKAEGLGDEARIYRSAVLGLYPATNEALLRDTQRMLETKQLEGPVLSFVKSSVALQVDASQRENAARDQTTEPGAKEPVEKSPRRFDEERLVAAADPCQSRTVVQARQARGLVIHGPPGTGKSQTITNIIGDHLARGERVLFVCDKRTALDVVFNRLDHLGLGELCALVHDPQRDQRDLYLSIRNLLDELAEADTYPKAQRELLKIDGELQKLHGELTAIHQSLMMPPAGDEHGHSFHQLMGEWLSIDKDDDGAVIGEQVQRATIAEFEEHSAQIELTLRRGVAVSYPKNPWASCIGVELDGYMGRPVPEMRRAMASCVEDARAADATRHQNIPAFIARQSLAEQSRVRQVVAERLRRIVDKVEPAVAQRVSAMAGEEATQLRRQLNDASPHLMLLKDGPLDGELALISREQSPGPSAIAQQLGSINEYLAIASSWHAFLHLGVKSRAAKTARQYGLALSTETAQRVRKFLSGLRARQALTELHRQLTAPAGAAIATSNPGDDDVQRTVQQYSIALEGLTDVVGNQELEIPVRAAMANYDSAAALLDGLERSAARAAALEHLENSLSRLRLFESKWLAEAIGQFREGKKAAETLIRLEEQFDTIESVIRINHELSRLPQAFRQSVESLLQHSAEPEDGSAWLLRGVLEGEIARRINRDPRLRDIDGERIAAMFERYSNFESRKRELVRDSILHYWRERQRARLLVSTGSRLNSEGAKLRQRLFVRGKRAMRLRQVIALGRQSLDENEPNLASVPAENVDVDQANPPSVEFESVGGDRAEPMDASDPLFDLAPVWMASPSTVAQIFPLEPVFDVVIFDEASQCKLEEALPVLVRAKRVVIAGDPKQLPPTRFFEAGIAESEHVELETDQDLFETQQSDIEDLLAAALNLEIEENYLDVHYRSRNSDLIEFSNKLFYNNRLQAIPGHPANRTQFAPITLYPVVGVYENRCNPAEAQRVCEIVRDLLRRAQPPSIGIACFNLMQRDLIVEMLDDLALEDAAFAAKLAAARERKGEGSFEGLFVKNLESVQGDERDHIIISTTYGPTRAGKFYRRFGPLGQPGGGRRLNVLVTRARHEVHLVTSIPREAYRTVDPVPADQVPNGGWLLFSYLRYAEDLGQQYDALHRVHVATQESSQPTVFEQDVPPFSRFSLAVGEDLADRHRWTTQVHWGNEGFRIDLAVHHPRRAEDMTVGVLCDFAQYRRAQDPVEWDLFRTSIHESQGWKLHRIWSPQYFRDSQRVLNGIAREVKAFLMAEESSNDRSPR